MKDKELLAMGLSKIYSSPQSALMDGSYNSVKESMEYLIQEVRRDEQVRFILSLNKLRIKMAKDIDEISKIIADGEGT
jgi:hypothetical protein